MATETVTTWQLPRYYRIEPSELEAWYVWREDQTQFDVLFVPFAGRVFLVKPLFRQEVQNGQPLSPHPLIARIVSHIGPPRFSQSDLFDTSAVVQNVHLSLGLSLNCNLSCLYCHAEAEAGSALRMDRDLLLKALDDAVQRAEAASGLVVSFTAGGEPTHEWDLFTLAVESVRKQCSTKGVPLKLLVTTNGVYGSTRREYIARNFSSVTLSVDGPPSVHNYQRPTVRGRPSFHIVWETAKYFAKRHVPFGVRATVTQVGVNTMSSFVKLVARELGGIPVAFEPIVPIGRGKRGILTGSLKPIEPQEFCEEFWQAYLEGERLGVKVSTSAMNLEKLVPTMCGALSLPATTVVATGYVTACHRDSRAFSAYGLYSRSGAFWRYDSLGPDKRAHISDLAKVPSECGRCFCRWMCGGGCPDLRLHGITVCKISRDLTFRGLVHEATKGGDRPC